MCENFFKLGYQNLAKNLVMKTFTNAKEKFHISGDIKVLHEKFDILKTAIQMIGIDGFENDIFDISHDENIPASDKWDLIGVCKQADIDKDTIIDMCVHVCRSNRANRGDYAFSKYQYCLDEAIGMIRSYGDNYEESVNLARNFHDQYKNQNIPNNFRYMGGLFFSIADF